MTKTAAILAGTAILVGGCHSSKQSETWRRVTHAPHPASEAGEADRVFAADLHRILLASHTPHKIVTAEFSYLGDYARDGVTQRTVVVYRDDGKKGENWWLMDERLNTPFWLPSEPLDKQISFYLTRPVKLVNVSDFSDPDHTKMVLPLDQKTARKTGTSTIQRAESHSEPAKPAKVKSPAKSPEKPKKPAESKIIPAPTAKVTEKPVEKPAPKPEAKTPAKPVAKPEAKVSAKPEAKAGSKTPPTAKAEAKPAEPEPIAPPPVKHEVKAEPAPKPEPKSSTKPEAKSAPKIASKEEKPKDKVPGNPPAKPSMGTPGKPAEHAPKSAAVGTEPPKKKSEEKPKETLVNSSPATKVEGEPPPKATAKATPTGKPAQPDLFPAEEAAPKEVVKPAKAEKKPVKPAVKATPSGKPVQHPDLFNRSESTPQAIIIDDGSTKGKKEEPKKDEATDKPKPEASAAKPNFFKRIFRRIFARHRSVE